MFLRVLRVGGANDKPAIDAFPAGSEEEGKRVMMENPALRG